MYSMEKASAPVWLVESSTFLHRDSTEHSRNGRWPTAEGGNCSGLMQARERAIAQLAALEEETQERLGQEQALLFQIHQMMLEDLDYRESVTGIISGQLMNAEYAVDQTAAQFSQIFAQMDDAYMQQRASDVLDVSRRLISVLMGREEAGWAGDEPVILAADDLVPSETARLDRQRVLAFVTAQGTGSSHTAIFARTMGIPGRGWPGRQPCSRTMTVGSVLCGRRLPEKSYIDPDAGDHGAAGFPSGRGGGSSGSGNMLEHVPGLCRPPRRRERESSSAPTSERPRTWRQC